MARTTIPLGGRGAAAETAAGTAGACGTATGASVCAAEASASIGSAGSAETSGATLFTAAGVNAWATACSRPRAPRPRPPRRRRPRARRASAAVPDCASGAALSADDDSAAAGALSTSGSDLSGAFDRRGASPAGAGDSSGSKYAGCNGGGAGWSAGSGAFFFFRPCKRSRIHLRMFRLVTQIAGRGQSDQPVTNHRGQEKKVWYAFSALHFYNDDYGKPGSASDSQSEIHLVNYV
jgi:hypothetical protein